MKISNKNEELGDCCKSAGHSNKKKNKKLGYFSMVLFLLMTSVQMVYAQVPTITSFSPASAKGGATVTITGTNFTNVTSVKFGPHEATSFTVASSTTITAVVSPLGESGQISVTTTNGTATINNFVFLPPPACNIVGPLKGCLGTNLTYTVEIAYSGNDQTSTPPVPELLISFPVGPNNTTNGAMIISNTPFVYNAATNSGTITAVLFPGTTTGKILGVLTVNAPGGTSTCSASITITDVQLTTSFLPIKCFGGTTNLEVNASSSGSNTTYKYTLSRDGVPDVIISSPFTSVIFPNLVAGDYTVTVEGNNLGCTDETKVTIGDGAKPVVLNCPTDATEASCQTQEQINTKFNAWLATFSTSGGTNPVITRNPETPSAPTQCGGTTTVTWTVTDDCGETQTCTRTFTVEKDDAKPIITPAADYSLVGCNTAWPTTVSAPWTDNCGVGGAKSGTIEGVAGAVQTSTDGCSQYRDYTFNATDDCGNAADQKTVRITRQYDMTPPVITCSPNKAIDCYAEVVFDTPTATDNCNGDVTIVVVSTSTDGLTRTWKATDACGNEATCSQTITVLPCEGCTLGYWKNHTDRWCSSYTPTMLFGDVFVNAPANLANLTLLEALNLGGGGIFNLARQGVAALLNACSDEVDYPAPYGSNTQSVINAVNAAYATGGNAPGKLATELDILNNSGCPLGGTSAEPKGGQSTTSPIIDNDKNNPKGEAAGFTAYPVPFKDKLVIRYDFEYVSNVKIEVLNAQGELILSKMDENSYLNKEINLHLHTYRGQEEVYLVKVTTNRGSSVKKVMSSK